MSHLDAIPAIAPSLQLVFGSGLKARSRFSAAIVHGVVLQILHRLDLCESRYCRDLGRLQ
jgi:hypothetical protein